MSARSNSVADSSIRPQALATAQTRPLYWSVRRELWENRSIWIAPLAASGVGLLAFLAGLRDLPRSVRALAGSGSAHDRVMVAMPYAHVGWLLLLAWFFVGIFYCLDALHGERRDRSILFWKSLPVSDLTTVMSKAIVPLVVMPVLVFPLAVIAQVLMLLVSTMVLTTSGGGVATLWSQVPLVQMELVLLYGLLVVALWHAPVYAWLLMVSAWSRRVPILWAFLPLAGIAIFERITFGTSYLGTLLRDRFIGFAGDAFEFRGSDGAIVDPHVVPLTALTPGRFLASPGLWVGLVLAVGFLAVATRLRRYREPI